MVVAEISACFETFGRFAKSTESPTAFRKLWVNSGDRILPNLRYFREFNYAFGKQLRHGLDVWVHNAICFRCVRGSAGDELTDVAINSKWVRDQDITLHEVKNAGNLGRESQNDAPVFMVMASIPGNQVRIVHGFNLDITEYENLVNVPRGRLTKLVVRKDGNDPYYGADGRTLLQ